MYASANAYSYGPGNASAGLNPNSIQSTGAPHQFQGQQPQHMMYNPQSQQGQAQQQYGIGLGHQSPYAGASGPGGGMGGNAGALGMMQNNGMAQMSAPHVPTYQTPYSSSPYPGNVPTLAPSNIPQNFMPTSSSGPSFSMNAPSMTPQHQAQRMQPPSSSTPTSGQRGSPFPGQHNTPPNAGQAPSQFATPQSINQTNLQNPSNNGQQAQGQTVVTPQTPNFPPGANMGPMATPLSPGSEAREKQRVTILLEINNGLLKEVMRIQAVQAEVKKDETPATATAEEKEKSETGKVEKLKEASREYVECMRRLQSNLAYLAAIADRSHKPSSQIPAHPAIMTAPSLSPKDKEPPKSEDEEKKEEEPVHEDQAEILNDLYGKLQALFPGVDPKKEPPVPPANRAAAQVQAQKQAGMSMAGGMGMSSGVSAGDQQKLNMMRQMQLQQQQQQAQAQAQGQGSPR